MHNCLNYIFHRDGRSPRSLEAAVSPELLSRSSLFQAEYWTTYKNAKPKPDLLFNNVTKLSTREYLEEFKDYIVQL